MIATRYKTPTKELFDAAKVAVLDLVEANLYNLFKKSNFYEIAQQVRKIIRRLDQFDPRVRRAVAKEILIRVEEGAGGQGEGAGLGEEDLDTMLEREALQSKLTMKILMLGAGESGKSTVARHLHFIHDKITDEERSTFKQPLEDNCILVVSTLIKNAEMLGQKFSPETQLLVDDVKMATKYGAMLTSGLAEVRKNGELLF